MAERRKIGSGINKTGLVRMKIATAIVSVVAFVGSLGIISYINPGVHSAVAASNQAQVVSNVSSTTASTSSSSSAALQLPAAAQSTSVRPLTRTRGS